MRKYTLRRYRPFVSSCVLVSFIIISLTGLMLMFHYSPFGNMGQWKRIHEWLGIVFLVGGVLHLAINWHAIKDYFGRVANFHQSFVGVGVCLFALVALMMAPQPEGRPGPHGPGYRGGASSENAEPDGTYAPTGIETPDNPFLRERDAVSEGPARSPYDVRIDDARLQDDYRGSVSVTAS